MNSNKRNRVEFNEPFIDFTNKSTKINPIISQPINNESLEPIIYYVINCHGSYSFFADHTYENVIVPDSIENIQKITYSPFGAANFMDHKDDENVLKNLKSYIPKLYMNDAAYGNELLDQIKNLPLLTSPEYRLNNFPKTDDIPGSKYRAGLQEIKRNGIYQGVIYNKENNVPIINKGYSTDPNDEFQNISVVFQKGGKFDVGQTILKSDDYETYLVQKGYTQDEYDIEAINTQLLLELSAFNGYKTVVIIDYSCDICNYYNGNPVQRNKVMEIRKTIDTNKLGRGGKKTRKKNQNKNQNKKRNKKKKTKRKKLKIKNNI